MGVADRVTVSILVSVTNARLVRAVNITTAYRLTRVVIASIRSSIFFAIPKYGLKHLSFLVEDTTMKAFSTFSGTLFPTNDK